MNILITGASQGIGAATARAFAATGKHQIALIARDENKLQQVQKDCQQLGSDARYFSCDFNQPQQLLPICDQVLSDWQSIDVLINNAGIFSPKKMLETSFTEFRSLMSINLDSAFILTQALLPRMKQQQRADIFFISSIAGIKGFPVSCAYNTSKHAILGLARSVREETKADNIRVMTLCPGGVNTPSWQETDIDHAQLMPVEDIANLIVNIQQLSEKSVVDEMIIRPMLGEFHL